MVTKSPKKSNDSPKKSEDSPKKSEELCQLLASGKYLEEGREETYLEETAN